MTSILPRFEDGPRTYTVVETVDGGQALEARANGVGVAAAGSTRFVGVAQKPARVGGSDPRAADGTGLLDTSLATDRVVAFHEGFVKVTYAAAAAHGDLLICAANGQVTVAGATPGMGTVIGRCAEPAGVAAGAQGLARLGL